MSAGLAWALIWGLGVSQPAEDPIATRPGEGEVLATLGLLAAAEPADVLRGLDGAERLGRALFDEPVQRLARTGTPGVRARALAVLAKLGWPERPAELMGRVRLVSEATTDPEAEVRLAAVLALGAFPFPEAMRTLAEVPQGSPELAAAVERARAQLRAKDSVQRLTDWLSGSAAGAAPPEWYLARAAAQLLAEPSAAGSVSAVTLLLAADDAPLLRPLVGFALRAGNLAVRLLALEALERRPLPDDWRLLLPLLRDHDARLRAEVAGALARHSRPEVAEALGAQLAQEYVGDVIKALGAGLRAQETPALLAAIEPTLERGVDYRWEIAAFLVRERREPATLWPRIMTLTRARDEDTVQYVLAEPPEERRRVILPRLTEPQMEDHLELLLELLAPIDAELGRELLALLGGTASQRLVHAVGAAVSGLPSAEVVPGLEQALARSQDPVVRHALYGVIAAREGEEVAPVLARGIREERDPSTVAELLNAAASRRDPTLVAAAGARLSPDEDAQVLVYAVSVVEVSQDPSLIPPLARVASRRSAEEIGWRAYDAMLRQPGPGVVPVLRDMAADDTMASDMRHRAIADLGDRGGEEDLPFLEQLAERDDPGLRLAARDALHRISPAEYPVWDRHGRLPLVGASGAFGAFLLATTTEIAGRKDSERLVLGGGGALIFGATAYLLTLERDVSLGEAGYFTTLGVWGGLGGYSLARAAEWGSPEGSAPLWAAIGGELAGAAIGGLTLRGARFSPGDVLLTNGAAMSFGVAGVSGAYLARAKGRAGPADAFTLGALGAVVPLAMASPHLRVDGDTVLGVLATSAYGSWLGAFAPLALTDSPRKYDTLAGIGLGQAAGFATGLVVSQLTDFDLGTIAWFSLGAATGAGLGGGYGLTHKKMDGRPTYALIEAGSLVGAGVLAAVGDHLEFHETDLLLVGLLTATGGIAGSRWAENVVEETARVTVPGDVGRRRLWGGRVLGTSLGLTSGLIVSQAVDLSPGELAMAGAGAGVLGAGAAGVALALPQLDESDFSIMFGVGAGIGGLGMALLSPRLRYEPSDAALALSSTTLGGFLGSYAPAFWTAEGEALRREERVGGAMAGATLGVLTAGVLSQVADIDAQRVLRADVGGLGGMALGGGIGLLIPAIDRRGTVALTQLGGVAGFVGASLTERRSVYTGADRFHLALGTGLGAWHGSLLPYLWRTPRTPVPDEEVLGGALVGAAVGGFASRLSVKLSEHGSGDVFEVALWNGVGAGLGAGAWLVPASRRERYRALAGTGLLSWAAGELLAPYTQFDENDSLLWAALLSAGAGAGWTLPYWREARPSPNDQAAGAAFGAGALGLIGLGLTQAGAWEEEELGLMLLTSGTLSAAMYGVGGALAEPTRARRYSLAGAGAYAGLGVGLLAAPFVELDDGALELGANTALLGAWLGYLAPRVDRGVRADAEQERHGALAGAAFGAMLGTGLGQLSDDNLWAFEASYFGAAGALASEGLRDLRLPRGPRRQALTGQILAVSGFAVGGLLSPYTEVRETDVMTVGTVALLGAWHGTFAPLALDADAASRPGRGARGGLMVGTAAGFLLGHAAGQLTELELEDNAELLAASSVGSRVGWGAIATLGRGPVMQARGLELGSAAGLVLGAATHGLTTFDGEDVGLVAMGGLWGAWHGLWVGGIAAGEDGDRQARRMAGGAALGAGAGFLGTAIASQALTRDGEDLAEATVWMGGGNLLGLGAARLWRLESDERWWLDGAGAAALALGLGVSGYTEYTGDDARLVLLTTSMGALHGGLLAPALWKNPQGNDASGGVALGAGVGLFSGMLAAQRLELEVGDLAEVGMAAFAGDAVGFGLSAWLDLGPRQTARLVAASGVAGMALGLWSAQDTSYDGGDRLLTLFGASLGGWLGGWAPATWQDEAEGSQHGAGVLLGMGAGAIGGAAAAQLLDYDKSDVGEIMLGGSLSTTAGAGLGLLLSKDDAVWVGMMEATGLVGTAVTAAIAKETTYSASDAGLGAVAALYGIYQGAGLTLLSERDDRKVAGAMLLAGSAGAIAGTYLGQYLHLDGTEILMLSAGSAWGVLIGGFSAAVIKEELGHSRNVVALGVGTTALATDVALFATGIGISRLVGLSPERFAWINVAGGMGLVTGTAGAALSNGALSIKEGIVYGSLGGLILGTAITGFMDFPERQRVAKIELDEADGARALLPKVDVWMPSVQVLPDDRPEADATRFVFTVTGTYR